MINIKRKALNIFGSSGYVDADYQAIISRALSLGYSVPSFDEQVAGSQLLIDLKNSGVWEKLDVFYVFATSAGANFSRLNWKNPNTFQISPTLNPTFISKIGWDLSQNNSYLSTTFNPSVGTNNYKIDNASRFIYVSKAIATNARGILDGDISANSNRLLGYPVNSNRVNSVNTYINNVNMIGGGLKYVDRTSSNDISFYSTGVTDVRTQVGGTLQNTAQLIGRNVTTTTGITVGAYGMGAALSGLTEVLEKAIYKYMTFTSDPFEAEYQAVINFAVSNGYALPSPHCQYVHNLMVKRLKADGYWGKMDVFYHFANDADTIDFATINWKNPNLYQCTLANNPVWEKRQGIITNGTNHWIDTNWNPAIHGVKYTLDNAHFSCRNFTLTNGNAIVGNSASTSGIGMRDGSSNQWYLNSTANIAVAIGTTGAGLRGASRTSSTDILIHLINNAHSPASDTRASTSTSIPNSSVTLGRRGTTVFGAGIFEGFFAGEAFTNDEWISTMQIITSATRM